MKKFIGVIMALLMVLCAFQIAEPATAQPRDQNGFNPNHGNNNQITGPQPAFLWRNIDQGQLRINENTKVSWKTYKFRYNRDHVWINSTTYKRTNNVNTNNNMNTQNFWNWNNWNNMNNRNNNNHWSINSITITRLDKFNWRVLRITKNTYDPRGVQIGNTKTKIVNTRLSAVGYYWTHRFSLVIPRNNGFM